MPINFINLKARCANVFLTLAIADYLCQLLPTIQLTEVFFQKFYGIYVNRFEKFAKSQFAILFLEKLK